MPGKLLSAEEMRLAMTWYQEDDMTPGEIGKLLRRDKSTMTRLLVKQSERLSRGQPKALSSDEVDRVVGVLNRMLAEADGEHEVTAAMLRREARVKASTRTILRELHARKIFFRRLREKPLLTKEDVKSRLTFARKYKGKTAQWWNTHIDMHIDLKFFPVLLTYNHVFVLRACMPAFLQCRRLTRQHHASITPASRQHHASITPASR